VNLRIGSRGSKLARAQAEWIGRELKSASPDLNVSFTWITTTGDKIKAPSLQDVGGKGLFVKEIEESLLGNEIDLAVHSLKDLPQMLSPGLQLGPFPRREDPRDALLSRFGEHLHELPRGSIIGTSSPRRRAQIYNCYKKKYAVEPIRGNVDTRLKKLENGDYAAIVVAAAGLKRLGLESSITQTLEFDEMLPAPGQGCLGLELRADDERILNLVEKIKHEPSDFTARAERSFLQAVGGDCFTPVACSAIMVGEELHMEALILDPDGTTAYRVQEQGPATEAELVGAKLGGRLLYEGGSEILIKLDSK